MNTFISPRHLFARTTPRALRGALLSGVLLMAGSLTLTGCDGQKDGAAGDAAGGQTFAFVPKSREHSFWLAVIRGAEKAAAEHNVTLLVQSPTRESDVSMQVDLVNTLRTEGAAGMMLAPLNDESLLRPVKEFGKPVVIMDSPLAGTVGEDFASFVGTENETAGALGAEALAAALGDNKKVVMLRYLEGSASTEQRESGFLEGVGALEVVSSNQYAGAGISEAQAKAAAMADTLSEVGGVFTPNQPSSIGMLNFLRDSGLAGKTAFVAFDASIELVAGLVAGEVSAIVVQDPETMGQKAVTTMIDVVAGKTVAPHVDTGAVIVTKENLSDARVQSILLAYDKLIGEHLPAVAE